jgi:hypothetical protein
MTDFGKKINSGFIATLLALSILLLASIVVCSAADTGTPAVVDVEKVEVYHFHLKQQCYSCITLGELAEETINANFADELESGKVVFGHINVQDPANKEIVDAYGASGSSLMIGVHSPEGFQKEENIKVWYKIGKKEEYESYLKELIEKRLSGDLSEF